MKILTAVALLLFLAACAEQRTRSHAEELSQARQDDEYCVSLGTRFPDTDYVGCRMKLQNRRLYRQWQSVQIMDRSGQPGLSPATPSVPSEKFKPIDPAGFQCWRESQFGGDYILCGKKGG